MFEEGKNSSCLRSFYEGTDTATELKSFKLIAVTDANTCPRSLPEQVKRIALCAHKPQQLILRAKELDSKAYAELAQKVLTICQKHGIELIIHSHWQLALELGVKRVHLPLSLLAQTPLEARQRLFISSSVHSVAEAQKALEQGAKALIAGHIYTTSCKAGMPPRGLSFLRNIHAAVVKHTTPADYQAKNINRANSSYFTKESSYRKNCIPIYAIGGIGFDAQQWQELAQQGANGACIMSAYMQI
ncbi:MAG: thiamine phosphate synthase [Phascolarctobacterium sp.]|nr:thiamine phosphate synthase [Phascolarctobacterium sp.]